MLNAKLWDVLSDMIKKFAKQIPLFSIYHL